MKEVKEEKKVTDIQVEDKQLSTQVTIAQYPTQRQIDEYSDFLRNYDAFIDKQLKKDIDYGLIPGVQKPSLLKPGAEKLEKLMFLTHKKECVDRTVEEGFISFTYRTTIFDKTGNVKAVCEGCCNSKEKKYRYETVFENQATPEQKLLGKLETRMSKGGKPYKVYVIEKKDNWDQMNTIMKMAEKRSYVGAILEATNSSGRFTSDVEDMNIQVESEPVVAQAVQKKKTYVKREVKEGDKCKHCGSLMVLSKKGNMYCQAMCWKKK